MAAREHRWSGVVNRDSVTDMLKRAGDETDPVERGLLLAEAQVLATLDVAEGLEVVDGKLALLYIMT